METSLKHLGLARRFIASMLAITIFTSAGCATPGPRVHSDFNRSTDFAAYKTFGFPAHTGTDRGGYTTLMTTYFKDALQHEMTRRGYTFTADNPDLLLNFYTTTRESTEVYPYPDPAFGFGFRYGRPRFGFYSEWPFYPDVDAVQVTTGKIKVDVIDAKRQQTIWEANTEERLTDQAQDNPQPHIARLVEAMFKKFPQTSVAVR